MRFSRPAVCYSMRYMAHLQELNRYDGGLKYNYAFNNEFQ